MISCTPRTRSVHSSQPAREAVYPGGKSFSWVCHITRRRPEGEPDSSVPSSDALSFHVSCACGYKAQAGPVDIRESFGGSDLQEKIWMTLDGKPMPGHLPRRSSYIDRPSHCPRCEREYIVLSPDNRYVTNAEIRVQLLTDYYGRSIFRVRNSALCYRALHNGRVFTKAVSQCVTLNLKTMRLYRREVNEKKMLLYSFPRPQASKKSRVLRGLYILNPFRDTHSEQQLMFTNACCPITFETDTTREVIQGKLTPRHILSFYNENFPQWPIPYRLRDIRPEDGAVYIGGEFFGDLISAHDAYVHRDAPDIIDPADMFLLATRAIQQPVWTLLLRSGLPHLGVSIGLTNQAVRNPEGTNPMAFLGVTPGIFSLLREIDLIVTGRLNNAHDLERILKNLEYLVNTLGYQWVRKLHNKVLAGLAACPQNVFDLAEKAIKRYGLPRKRVFFVLASHVALHREEQFVDTLSMLEQLNIPHLGRVFNFVRRPLKEVHDELAKRVAELNQDKYDSRIKEVATAWGRLAGPLDEDLVVELPQCTGDLREESRVMCHCVASYASQVAKGETVIAFIRKEGEPYVTLEIQPEEKILRQAKLKHDNRPDKPLAERIAAWAKSRKLRYECSDLEALKA